MVRELNHVLLLWQQDPEIAAVVVRGSNKEGPFGAYCAGGDIRYFHQAALSGDVTLEDFFTEEYSLNHLIHNYSKPYIALMDGIVMGGGMGISQGAALRVVTERTKMAMPETHIGLFPDVGGGYFLGRCQGPKCPDHMGEYLALTGHVLRGGESLHVGLADVCVESAALPALWEGLHQQDWASGEAVVAWLREQSKATTEQALAVSPTWQSAPIDNVFGLPTVAAIEQALQGADEWSVQTLKALHHQSPMMLCVTLEQIRRGRHMTLAQDLRMERDLVRHCFQTDHLSRRGVSSETVEGIRALAVDKDHAPKWQPERIAGVTPEMVLPFFESPWPASAHPLRHLL
jgi:enoyl-CoA hydratase